MRTSSRDSQVESSEPSALSPQPSPPLPSPSPLHELHPHLWMISIAAGCHAANWRLYAPPATATELCLETPA